MNNIEQNALRIAELIGYKKNIIYNTYSFANQWSLESEIIRKFSSYQGLMPLVFECNNKSFYGDIFNISVYYSSVVIYIDGDRTCTYWYKSEPEFIEALQLACIKYLELK